MLSDGQVNKGKQGLAEICNEVAELAKIGISTSTVGFGLHFNEQLMTQMAVAGRGNAMYGEDVDDLIEPFDSEISLLRSLAWRDVSLEIVSEEPASPWEMRNDYPANSDRSWRLPSIASGSEAWVDTSDAAILKAHEFKESPSVTFDKCNLENFGAETLWDVAIAVDLVQPIEHNFASLIEKVGNLVRPNGDLIVIGNFVDVENVDEFFRSIGFACVGAQLTGGYQQGLSGDFTIDWSTKAALHLKKNLNLKSIDLPISGDMHDFAEYANSGEFPPREINRSYFLPRASRKII